MLSMLGKPSSYKHTTIIFKPKLKLFMFLCNHTFGYLQFAFITVPVTSNATALLLVQSEQNH